jgi:hypothetical protein
MRSIRLRREPSVRQVNAILTRVERGLRERGLDVSRHGVGGLHFRVPPPWRTRGAGLLTAATSGRVRVTAGRGERRQVRYDLKFTTLQALITLASFVLVIVGWQRARISLIATVALIWLLLYLPAHLVANAQLHRIVLTSALDVIERRSGSRTPAPTSGPETDPTQEAERIAPSSDGQAATS